MTTAARTTVDQTNYINLEVMSHYGGIGLAVTSEDGQGEARIGFDKITADGLAYILSHPPKTNPERTVAYGPMKIMFAAGAETTATLTFERGDRSVRIELDDYEISTLSNMLSQAAKRRLEDHTQFKAGLRLQTPGIVSTDTPEPETEEDERKPRQRTGSRVTMLE